jgi:hypothetical protein
MMMANPMFTGIGSLGSGALMGGSQGGLSGPLASYADHLRQQYGQALQNHASQQTGQMVNNFVNQVQRMEQSAFGGLGGGPQPQDPRLAPPGAPNPYFGMNQVGGGLLPGAEQLNPGVATQGPENMPSSPANPISRPGITATKNYEVAAPGGGSTLYSAAGDVLRLPGKQTPPPAPGPSSSPFGTPLRMLPLGFAS